LVKSYPNIGQSEGRDLDGKTEGPTEELSGSPLREQADVTVEEYNRERQMKPGSRGPEGEKGGDPSGDTNKESTECAPKKGEEKDGRECEVGHTRQR